MDFTSIPFYVLLAPAAILYYNLPGRWRPAGLLALSYAFYAWFSLPYLGLLVLASAVTYGLGLAIPEM